MRGGTEILVDMSALDEMIGTSFALGSIGRGSRYMQDLLISAFEDADVEFNRQIAAFAAASGRLGHMFEWGTIGINTSPSNMNFSPMDKRARLWDTVFLPNRSGNSNISYKFEPSVGIVPKPPAGKTGIEQSVLNRLRDHVFWNKAFVMETGVDVQITPKADNESGLLFVPNIWKGEEGYSMYARSTSPDISRRTKGTFTSMFLAYWNAEGGEMMDRDVKKWFEEDIYRAYMSIKGRQKLRRPMAYHDEIIRYKAETVRKDFEAAARERVSLREGRDAE